MNGITKKSGHSEHYELGAKEASALGKSTAHILIPIRLWGALSMEWQEYVIGWNAHVDQVRRIQ